MNHRIPSRVAAAAAIVMFVLVATIAPAAAHDPIFLTADQTTPETGPYLPDGTISFAIYGSLLAADDTRGLEFDLRDGDDLFLQLLIPDLEPELSLADGDLPYLQLTTPAGEVREIRPDVRSPFADPFSGTNYVTIYESVEPGVAGGRYQVVVTGAAATRFAVAVGTSEEFFTPTQRSGDKPSNFAEIAEPLGVWYSTPAGEEAAGAPAESGVDVDVDLIEEELAALAEAEEAANEEVVADEAPEADEPAEVTTTAPSTTAAPETDDADTDDVDELAQADTGDGDDDGGGLGWVAPVVIGVAIGLGAALYIRRGKTD